MEKKKHLPYLSSSKTKFQHLATVQLWRPRHSGKATASSSVSSFSSGRLPRIWWSPVEVRWYLLPRSLMKCYVQMLIKWPDDPKFVIRRVVLFVLPLHFWAILVSHSQFMMRLHGFERSQGNQTNWYHGVKSDWMTGLPRHASKKWGVSV